MSAPQSNLETLPRSIRVVLALGLVALIAFPFLWLAAQGLPA